MPLQRKKHYAFPASPPSRPSFSDRTAESRRMELVAECGVIWPPLQSLPSYIFKCAVVNILSHASETSRCNMRVCVCLRRWITLYFRMCVMRRLWPPWRTHQTWSIWKWPSRDQYISTTCTPHQTTLAVRTFLCRSPSILCPYELKTCPF